MTLQQIVAALLPHTRGSVDSPSFDSFSAAALPRATGGIPHGWIEFMTTSTFTGVEYSYPSRGTKQPAPLSVGEVLPLGPDGSITLSAGAGGAAGTIQFRIWDFVGGALRVVRSGSATVTPGSGVVTTTAKITMKAFHVVYDSQAVPGTGQRTVQASLDTNTPPGLNDPLAVFCLASTAALSQSASGILLVPGGDYVWPGGPAFITEIADLGAGIPNCYAAVAY